jgi:WD repeat and SOF domain-containing protein 1
MKIKVLNRSVEECTRERTSDLQRVFRNPDPALHKFERAREYTRALNAVKVDRMFAKPFLHAMDDHKDGVFCMAKNQKKLNVIGSGACDGQIRVWRLSDRETLFSADAAHKGFVRGLAFTSNGERMISCGDDKTIKLWSPFDSAAGSGSDEEGGFGEDSGSSSPLPLATFAGKRAFTAVDHTWANEPIFATAGTTVDIWNAGRSQPINSFDWGVDTIYSVRWNPAQTNVVASTAADRSIGLYDVRLQTPIKKLMLQMVSNAICWNPLEPFNFTVANEDHNLYTFDMRKLDSAMCVHMDHTGAVLDLDFSPTGQEFVAGSYDRTLRIFKRAGLTGSGHSREVYHTSRMQRIFCVKFSMDARYVVSGSDDTNVRLWKAKASESLGVLLPREKQAQDYNEKLKQRYGHLDEVRRIDKHRHVPKIIKKTREKKRVMKESIDRRTNNKRNHTTPGTVPYKAARKKKIVTVIE